MRAKNIAVAGKDIVIRELKIKEIKDNFLPKIEPAWDSIAKSDFTGVIDCLGEQIVNIFPELAGIDIEECYPSELEVFLEAWIEVNFSGVKRLLGPLLSLVKQGQLKPV